MRIKNLLPLLAAILLATGLPVAAFGHALSMTGGARGSAPVPDRPGILSSGGHTFAAPMLAPPSFNDGGDPHGDATPDRTAVSAANASPLTLSRRSGWPTPTPAHPLPPARPHVAAPVGVKIPPSTTPEAVWRLYHRPLPSRDPPRA